MISLGSNVHLFARPERRESLRSLFEAVLKSGPVIAIDFPGMVRIPAKAITHSGVSDHPAVGGRVSGRREACFSP